MNLQSRLLQSSSAQGNPAVNSRIWLRDIPLANMETSARIGRAITLFDVHHCDALLVTKMENIAYLTGFSGSSAFLLLTRGEVVLTTDGRYRDQASSELEQVGVEANVTIGNISFQLETIARTCASVTRLGLESAHVPWSFFTRLSSELNAELVPTSGLIESLRVIKDVGEVARIERACAIADLALGEAKQRLLDGPTESEFAAELEYAMRMHGSSAASFETIVASGPNSALPHMRPTSRKIASGDLVVIDFGAIVDGYHSDMTRTFVIDAPSASQRAQIQAVALAQQAGVDALAPGVTGASVDGTCRKVLDASGFGEFFTHGTGHGVGREIHEAPSVGAKAPDILRKGMIVTVEPGVYLPESGGVRIEDTLVMTDDGARPLTLSTKDYQL